MEDGGIKTRDQNEELPEDEGSWEQTAMGHIQRMNVAIKQKKRKIYIKMEGQR